MVVVEINGFPLDSKLQLAKATVDSLGDVLRDIEASAAMFSEVDEEGVKQMRTTISTQKGRLLKRYSAQDNPNARL